MSGFVASIHHKLNDFCQRPTFLSGLLGACDFSSQCASPGCAAATPTESVGTQREFWFAPSGIALLGSFSRLRGIGGLFEDRRSGRVLAYSGNTPGQQQKLSSIAAGADQEIANLDHGIALAIWDGSERVLTLATDRYGNSPLFYYRDGSRLVFASEAKTILVLLGLRATINREVLAELVWFGHPVADQTLFQGILKLPAATKLRFSASGVEVRRYWSLSYSSAPKKEWPELLDAAEQALARAVAKATANPNTAVAITGGIDSRAIFAEVIGQGIETDGFTAGAEDSADMQIAVRLAQHLNGRHRRLFLDSAFAKEFPKYSRRLVWLTEGCLGLENCHLVYLSEQCRGLFGFLVDGGGAEISKRGLMRWPSQRVRSKSDLPKLIANRYGRPELGRLLFGPAEFRPVEEQILSTLARLFAAVEHETIGDTLDAYFLGVNWRNFYAQAVALQAGFIEGRLPFLEPEYVALVSRLPLAVRRESGVHFHAINKRAPFLKRYPRAFQGLPVPFTENPLLKYALPAAGILAGKLGIHVRRRHAFPVREWLESELIPELTEMPERFAKRSVLDPQAITKAAGSSGIPLDLRFSARLLLWRLELWHGLFADPPDPFTSLPKSLQANPR